MVTATSTDSQVQEFLSLFGGTVQTFQTFDDDGDRKLPRLAPKPIHGDYNDLKARLTNLNRDGAGVFFTVNMTDGKGRTAENIVEVRALFCDFDNGKTPDPTKLALLPEPSIIVRSSGTGLHYYWLVNPGMPLDAFTPSQQRLIDYLGADDLKDLPRVLRLPGFQNKKPKHNAETVSILSIPGTRYDWTEVLSNVPQLTQAPKAPKVNAVLKREVAKVAKAVEGTRKDTIFNAGKDIGKEIAKGRLNYDDAHKALVEAGLKTGLPESEVIRNVESGLEKGSALPQGTQDDDGLLLSKGLINGSKAPMILVAFERAKSLYPSIKFDILVGRWTMDEGKTFFSATKLAHKLAGDFVKVQEWHGHSISTDGILSSLKAMELQEEYQHNSRLEFFEGLDWEGSTEDAELFLTQMLGKAAAKLATDFEALMFAKQLVGTVARVYKPGCPVQTMLVIQGVGNAGKSTLVESLCPRIRTDYIQMSGKDLLDPDQKRYLMQVEGRLFLVVDEVGQLTATEDKRDELKAKVTLNIDQGVRMHGTESEDIERTYTMWATVNEVNFLPVAAEDALKRRFFPVRTLATRENRIDNPWIVENLDLIWAAAKHLYRSNWGHSLTDQEWKAHDRHIDLFCNGGMIEEAILGWMRETGKLNNAFDICTRYMAGDIASSIWGNNYKPYLRNQISAWMRSDKGKEAGWQETKSKGRSYFTNIADSRREALARLDEDEAPATPPEPETVKSEPTQDEYKEDFGFDPVQPDRPF